MYQNISVHNYLPAIVASLYEGNLRAVCDDSFDTTYETTAWWVDGDGLILRGVNIVPMGVILWILRSMS